MWCLEWRTPWCILEWWRRAGPCWSSQSRVYRVTPVCRLSKYSIFKLYYFTYTLVWMIYRRPSVLAVVWFGSSPTPFPLSHQLVISLSQSSCVSPVELIDGGGGGGGGGRGTKSYDREKAWPSIIHTILSGMKRWFEILYSMFWVFLYNKRKSFGEKHCFIVSWLCPFPGKIISSEFLEKPTIKKILLRLLRLRQRIYFVNGKRLIKKKLNYWKCPEII